MGKVFGALRVLFLLAVIAAIAWFGMAFIDSCSRSNSTAFNKPEIGEAAYSITVENTRNVILADDLEDEGGIVTLYGYWEAREDGYIYIDRVLKLDRAIFGKITISRRVE